MRQYSDGFLFAVNEHEGNLNIHNAKNAFSNQAMCSLYREKTSSNLDCVVPLTGMLPHYMIKIIRSSSGPIIVSCTDTSCFAKG
jgi:hypothetical protein